VKKYEQELQEHVMNSPAWYMFPCFKKARNLKKAIYRKARNHVQNAENCAEKILELIRQHRSEEADTLLLNTARWNYSNQLEKNSVAFFVEAKENYHDCQEQETKEEGDEDMFDKKKEKPLTMKQVLTRHIIGWIIITGYMFIFAYYVVLFGISHGPRLTNSWLASFFLSFAEGIFIQAPFKGFMLFYILPLMTQKDLQPSRLRTIPPYASSVLLAEMFPQLPASQLIMARASPDYSQFEARYHFFLGYSFIETVLRKTFQIVLFISFSAVLLLPYVIQEPLWDVISSTIFNFLIIGVATAFINHQNMLWGIGVSLFAAILVYFNRKRLERCLKRFSKNSAHSDVSNV